MYNFLLNNKYISAILILLTSVLLFPGCEIIGGIFKAGLWVGIIIVVLIVALIMWIMRKTRT